MGEEERKDWVGRKGGKENGRKREMFSVPRLLRQLGAHSPEKEYLLFTKNIRFLKLQLQGML